MRTQNPTTRAPVPMVSGSDDDTTTVKQENNVTLSTTTPAPTITSTTPMISILGFGSLLSERSTRLTFPNLENFRLVRVPNYRRVFGHATSIFFRNGIAHRPSLQMASLSAEYADGHVGFMATVFDVSSAGMMDDGVPSRAFLEREEEFAIISVPYIDHSEKGSPTKTALICARSTDEAYVKRWGQDHLNRHFTQYGIDTIWNWSRDSGLRPCAVYLRHCYLAAQSMGDECFTSFLDETFLVDRVTTIRKYLEQYPEVLQAEPPPELRDRYCG